VKESEVVEMQQRLAARDLSVDAPLEDGESGTMLDLLPARPRRPKTPSRRRDAPAHLHQGQGVWRDVDGQEREIFDERLMAEEPLTLQEIADRYGISRERVRQIEERVKKKLKAYLLAECQDLEDAVIDIIR